MKKRRKNTKKLLEIIEQKNASNEQIMESYKTALKEAYKTLALHAIYFKFIFIFFIFFILITIDFTLTYTELSKFPIITFIYHYIILIPIKFIRFHWMLFTALGAIILFIAKIILCCEASGTSNKAKTENTSK